MLHAEPSQCTVTARFGGVLKYRPSAHTSVAAPPFTSRKEACSLPTGAGKLVHVPPPVPPDLWQ